MHQLIPPPTAGSLARTANNRPTQAASVVHPLIGRGVGMGGGLLWVDMDTPRAPKSRIVPTQPRQLYLSSRRGRISKEMFRGYGVGIRLCQGNLSTPRDRIFENVSGDTVLKSG